MKEEASPRSQDPWQGRARADPQEDVLSTLAEPGGHLPQRPPNGLVAGRVVSHIQARGAKRHRDLQAAREQQEGGELQNPLYCPRSGAPLEHRSQRRARISDAHHPTVKTPFEEEASYPIGYHAALQQRDVAGAAPPPAARLAP